MRWVAMIGGLTALALLALWRFGVLHQTDSKTVIADAKLSARAWSQAQRPEPEVRTVPDVLVPSGQCKELNRSVVEEMYTLYQMGVEPPFGTAPLMEVLRSGNCTIDNASVQVMLGWIESARKTATTPRNNEP